MSAQEHVEHVNRRLPALSKLFSLKFTPASLAKLVQKNKVRQEHADLIQKAYTLAEAIYPGRCSLDFTLKQQLKIAHSSGYGYDRALYNEYLNNKVDFYTNHGTCIDDHFHSFSHFYIDYFYVVISFPEIIISNSHGDKYKIQDLFVRVPIRLVNGKPLFMVERIEGTRSTQTTIELSPHSGYCHSHLPGVAVDSAEYPVLTYQGFCTGSGDINNVVSLANGEWDDDMMSLLYNNLVPFLEWESLEGNPYRKIETCHKGIKLIDPEANKFEEETMSDSFRQLEDRLIIKLKEYPIDWFHDGQQYRIMENKKFETFLLETVGKLNSEYITRKTDRGEYCVEVGRSSIRTIGSTQRQALLHQNKWIPFQNQKMYLNIVDPSVETENKITPEYFIHPQLKKYVRNKLEERANLLKVRQGGFERANKLINS